MAVRTQTDIARSEAALSVGSAGASARPPTDPKAAQRQNEKLDVLPVRPQRRRDSPHPRHIDKAKTYMSGPPLSWLPASDSAAAADTTTPPEATPSVTPTVRPPEPPEPSESEPPESEPPEPSVIESSPSQPGAVALESADLDDTTFCDADVPSDADAMLPKRRASDSYTQAERMEKGHYVAAEVPVWLRRPAGEFRLSLRYIN